MTWVSGLFIYFLIWWVVLFAVLPWGVKSQQESGEFAQGTDPGAPAMHRIWLKLLWTTAVASMIFAVLYVVYIYQLITLDQLMSFAGPRR